MGHLVARCDVLDVLEEAAVVRKPILVELRDGHRFEDRVKDVVTQDGEDFAVFEFHAMTPVSSIKNARRAESREPTYAGKRGQSHEMG